MMMSIFIKSLGAGFAIAAPVGPVGVLCIRRTLSHGRWVGLASGMGAVAADTAYACLAGFGLHYVNVVLSEYQSWLHLTLGIILLAVGMETFWAGTKPSRRPVVDAGSLLGAFVSSFIITLANPLTFVAYLAVFSAFQLANYGEGLSEAVIVATGVMVGSAAWWLMLTITASTFRHWIDAGSLRWINRIAGLLIGLFGLWALVNWTGLC